MFEEAGRLEAHGDYVKASHEYIDMLKREPEWSEARTRLELIGPLAVDSLIAHAYRAEAASRFPHAVSELDRLDGLREAASGVGVQLEAPQDDAEYRRSMVDQAITFYLDEAATAETAGTWSAALAAYDHALRYGMPASRRDEINISKAGVHLRWAAPKYVPALRSPSTDLP